MNKKILLLVLAPGLAILSTACLAQGVEISSSASRGAELPKPYRSVELCQWCQYVGISLSGDGSYLAAITNQGKDIVVLNIQRGSVETHAQWPPSPSRAVFSGDDLVIEGRWALTFHSPPDWKAHRTLQIVSEEADLFSAMPLVEDKRVVAKIMTRAEEKPMKSRLAIYNLDGDELHSYAVPELWGNQAPIALLGGGSRLAWFDRSEKGKIKILDVGSSDLREIQLGFLWRNFNVLNGIFNALYIEAFDLFAAGCGDNTIRFIREEPGSETIYELPLHGMSPEWKLAYSTERKLLFTMNSGFLIVWKLPEGIPLRFFRGHFHVASGISASKQGDLVAFQTRSAKRATQRQVEIHRIADLLQNGESSDSGQPGPIQ